MGVPHRARPQIEKEVRAFSRTSGRLARSCIVVGGVAMQEQRHELRSGVEIVVATPGRFIDHLQQGNTNLERISFVVLDEADRMLDMGFEPQVRALGRGEVPARMLACLSSAAEPAGGGAALALRMRAGCDDQLGCVCGVCGVHRSAR